MGPESLTQLQREILGCAHEDYYGLWEIWGLVQTATPASREEEISRSAAGEVGVLAELGWIEVVRFPGGRVVDSNARLIGKADRDRILGDPDSWKVPEANEDQLRIATTDQGEDVVRDFW